MKVKTAGAVAISQGSKVKSVHEAKADFKIEFDESCAVSTTGTVS
jgi:hypothetical protein